MPGRPGPLQVEAAAVAVHVQHLAAGVQPRNDTAFQRFRVKFLRPQAARRDLCLVKAAGAGDGERKALHLPGDTLQKEALIEKFEELRDF